MNTQARAGRALQLIEASPAAEGGRAGRSVATPRPAPSAATQDHLRTLLTLCQSLADASAAGLYVEVPDGWTPLVHVGQRAQSLSRLRAIVPPLLARPAAGAAPPGVSILRLRSHPGLAMALIVERAVKPPVNHLLEQALGLALPFLEADEGMRRLQHTRERLLDVQEELAHALRTPLTAISGFAQLLGRPGDLDERRRRSYATVAVSESQQATAVIDRMVEFLAEEAAALDVPAESTDRRRVTAAGRRHGE